MNRYQTLTPEQRRQFIETIKELRARHQQESLKHLEKHGDRWTPDEDLELFVTNLTDVELAVKLGRTFNAVVSRKAWLRRLARQGKEPDYDWLVTSTGAIGVVRPHRITPCACATIDGDHEDWCPTTSAHIDPDDLVPGINDLYADHVDDEGENNEDAARPAR